MKIDRRIGASGPEHRVHLTPHERPADLLAPANRQREGPHITGGMKINDGVLCERRNGNAQTEKWQMNQFFHDPSNRGFMRRADLICSMVKVKRTAHSEIVQQMQRDCVTSNLWYTA